MALLNSSKKIRVLIVDDSALIRQILTSVLNADPSIEVVDVAADPYIARDRIKTLNPDVITLDINMPRMDGLSFLEKIMTLRPMPVVMISTLTQKGAKETLEALEMGAVDYIPKPTHDLEDNFNHIALEICTKVKAAAYANIRRHIPKVSQPTVQLSSLNHLPHLVAVGASTGGVEALSVLFKQLPKDGPPIVVVQHMPAGFTASFAARMNKQCAPHIMEAEQGMKLERGCIYIAPGNQHMRIKHGSSQLVIDLFDGPLTSGHKPSVDVLFESVAALRLRRVMGVILTGMGHDGAQGLLKLKNTGGITLGQNKESCLIYGMPRAAHEVGAVQKEVPLHTISQYILGKDI